MSDVRVKILFCSDISQHDYDSDYITKSAFNSSVSDWDTISFEDYEFLQQNLHRIVFKDVDYMRNNYVAPVLLIDDMVPINIRIKSIKDAIEAERAAREAEKEAARLRKEQVAAAKRLKKEAADEQARRVMYEQLKKEFGS